MNRNPRKKLPHWIGMAVLVASVGCGDGSTAPTRRPPAQPRADISDGAHGGNDDVFFLPPMADNPNHAPGYGDAFQAGLPVVYRIRDMTTSSHPVIKTLIVTGSSSDQHYHANWDTKSPALNPANTYRIEVWIDSRNQADVLAGIPAHCTTHPNAFSCSPIAFADVDVVSNGSQLKNVNTNEYIALQDGRTLPVKVRIENGWACKNNASCGAQVVANNIPGGQKVIVKSNDQLNAVALQGTWHEGNDPVVVTIENVSGELGGTGPGCAQALTVMLTTTNCVHITTDPPVVLTSEAVITTCLANPGDKRQLVVKYDVGETPRFLDDAVAIPCPEQIGFTPHSSNRLINLASLAMNRVSRAVRWATGVKPAYAIDLGVGGRLEIGDDFSFFSLGLPVQIEAVPGTDFQSALVNTTLPTPPKVRLAALHRHGDPLPPQYVSPTDLTGLVVTCAVASGNGSLVVDAGEVASAPATFNSDDDTYACPSWRMPATAKSNALTVSSNKHDALFLVPSGSIEGPAYLSKTNIFTFTATSVAPAGTINSVTLSSSTLIIDGPAVPYTANVTNPGVSLTGVFLQGQVIQGAAHHGAGGGPDVDCGGTGIFAPGGPCTTGFTAQATNSAISGVGTFTAGAATFRLQLIHGPTSTVLDTKDVPITLAALGGPSIVSVSLASTYLVIGGPNVPYTAVLANGGSPLPGVFLQGWIDQGSASRAAGGGADAECGAGTGVLPTTASCSYSFSTAASNGAAGSGTLVPGPATLRLDMNSYDGETQSVVATKLVPVTLVNPGVTIVGVSLNSTSAHLGGPNVGYTATLHNATASTIASATLQATVTQGSASRAAGGLLVTCGSPVGSLPPGPCNVTFSYIATNSTAGSGTLVPGAATLHFELRNNSGPVVLDTRNFAITITP